MLVSRGNPVRAQSLLAVAGALTISCGARSTLYADERDAGSDDGPDVLEPEGCSVGARDGFVTTESRVASANGPKRAAIYHVAPTSDGTLWVAGAGDHDLARCEDATLSGTGSHFVARLTTDLEVIEEWRFEAGVDYRDWFSLHVGDDDTLTVFAGRAALALPGAPTDRSWTLARKREGGAWSYADDDLGWLGAEGFCVAPSGRVLAIGYDEANEADLLGWYRADLSREHVDEVTVEGDLKDVTEGCTFVGEDAVIGVFAEASGVTVGGHGTSTRARPSDRALHLVRIAANGLIAATAAYPLPANGAYLVGNPDGSGLFLAGETRGGSFGGIDVSQTFSSRLAVVSLDANLEVRWLATSDNSSSSYFKVSGPPVLNAYGGVTLGFDASSSSQPASFEGQPVELASGAVSLDGTGSVRWLVSDTMTRMTSVRELHDGRRLLGGWYHVRSLLPGEWPEVGHGKAAYGLLVLLEP